MSVMAIFRQLRTQRAFLAIAKFEYGIIPEGVEFMLQSWVWV
jgi:hypothetical protein